MTTPMAFRPAEAARALGVGRTTLYAWLNEGRIASFSVGATRLIPVAEIERFLSSQLVGGRRSEADHQAEESADARGIESAADRPSCPKCGVPT